MKTRRGFLKALLGAALVVPAVVACRTPKPFDLPAERRSKVRKRYAGRYLDAYDPQTGTVVDFKYGKTNPLWLDYNPGPTEWKNPGPQFFPNRTARLVKVTKGRWSS